MHGPPVLRHGDEPRSAAVVALVGLPQPDLEGQEGFISRQRGLQVVEAGERRWRTPRIVERQRNLSLGFLFSTLQPLELSQTAAPSLIVQRRIHEHPLDRGDGLEQLPPLLDGGVLRIRHRSRPVERVEQRPRPHALGHEEGQREIIVLAVLEQAPRQPVVVERPSGKERGTAVGIVLQRPERFHAVDGGQRVANGRGARLGVPAVPHVPAGAFGLRSGALGARCRFESPQLSRSGFSRVGGRVEGRFNPGADRLVMRVPGGGRQRETLLHVLHGRRSPFGRAGEEMRKGSVAPDHHQLVFGSHARLEGAPGQPNQLLPTIRRREQALLYRRRLERRCIWPSPASRCLPPPWRARRGDGTSRALRQSGPQPAATIPRRVRIPRFSRYGP